MPTDLSIIIVNYNTSQYVISCIRSIREHTRGLSTEIIVIDNSSSGSDIKEIESRLSDIVIVKNDTNQGFGRANNKGIEIAKGHYILLLNPDTLVVDDSIERSVKFMDSDFARDNNIGLLGIKLLNPDETVQRSTFGSGSKMGLLYNSNPILSAIKRSLLGEKINSTYNENDGFVEGISGAFMLFRREVFNKVRPFDPDIFMYSEETELCRNRISKYFRIYYWTGGHIIHLVNRSGEKQLLYNQNVLSSALVWYKSGRIFLPLYILVLLMNSITCIMLYPFAGERVKNDFRRYINGFKFTINQMLFDIPRFPPKWGAREKPLKYSGLK